MRVGRSIWMGRIYRFDGRSFTRVGNLCWNRLFPEVGYLAAGRGRARRIRANEREISCENTSHFANEFPSIRSEKFNEEAAEARRLSATIHRKIYAALEHKCRTFQVFHKCAFANLYHRFIS